MAAPTTLGIPVTVTRPTAREIFVEHGRFVLRVVRRLGVSEADVEDVAQEVFVTVHRKIESFDGTSTVRTWVFGIASRVASDYRKKAHRRREALHATPPPVAVEPLQQEAASGKELRAWLDRALDELDDAKRSIFVLYEMEGVPMQEIAEALGCPLNTAYSRLREARERVRAYFEQRRLLEEPR